ncbi:MAG: hypothetical protein FWC26_07945 [Fibromonadales bacterium]|nr:hypothetical protein [Fibromonadales bacterium]
MEDSIASATIVDTVHRFIADSVTLEVLKNSQEFYSSAFDKILIVLSIFVMLALAPGIWNLWKGEKYKKELKNTKERILDLENEFQKKLNKFDEELEKQKKFIKTINSELQSVKNHEI